MTDVYREIGALSASGENGDLVGQFLHMSPAAETVDQPTNITQYTKANESSPEVLLS